MAEILGLKNIKFLKRSVLNSGFDDNYFDFVFSNGVFHHTSDMWKCLKEQNRIMKPNGWGWIYLYGKGGIQWNSRLYMRKLMKNIDRGFVQNFLSLIKDVDFLALDTWYVPREDHTSDEELEMFLKKLNYKRYFRSTHGVKGDITPTILNKHKSSRLLWGSGDLRYIVQK